LDRKRPGFHQVGRRDYARSHFVLPSLFPFSWGTLYQQETIFGSTIENPNCPQNAVLKVGEKQTYLAALFEQK